MSADNFFRSSGEEFCIKGRLCIQGASSSIGDVFVFVIIISYTSVHTYINMLLSIHFVE